MTATDAAPDLVAAAERRWQDLLDRIHDLEARVTATTSAVDAALDAHLARLDVLRRHLARPTWLLPAPDPSTTPIQPRQDRATPGGGRLLSPSPRAEMRLTTAADSGTIGP
ncbi:hypothetical protein ACIRD3_12950 [Kitasatospora sp. NPDC093550]|uniref:hypothetical protein n=1 Tax=Kitasatospora sp. NPDC093550 TaxID=3364089 RepID=UPI003811758F